MKAGLRRTIALALGLCALTIPASAATTFTDVPSSYWGYSYINEAASKGLVSGIGNGKYGPEETLSNAQFVTMVCNLFYSNLVDAQSSSSDWWRPYMNVAYSAGLLQGTTAAQQYAASGGWTTSAVNGNISRYDMAQIISNLSTDQKWESPDSMSLVLSQLLIKDWSSVPTQYQTAVAVCYAKGFLTGDENGNFNGSDNSTRAQAAVVLCALDEANDQMTSPTYTNTNRLTNGLTATEENVADLVNELWATYPDYDVWDVDLSYTSQRLGSGTGDKAFVYMLSDRVFGAMPVNEIDDPADLRVGDVISLDDGDEYGLVYKVTGGTFTYASCDSEGWISWKNDMSLDDLGRDDTVYTRYLTLPAADDVLANGDEATDRNVERALDDLQDERDYREGRSWDLEDEYDSDVLGSADGTRGFAYCISDEIFGDLDYERVDADEYDDRDLRVGDVIYDRYGNGLYGVVVDVRSSYYTYVSVDEDDEKIYWDFTGYYEDLDWIYTRYPEDSDRSEDDETLANGDRITTTNVENLLEEVLDSRYGSYYDDREWDMDYWYDDSEVFPEADGNEGFAYFISDKIFGDLDYEDVRNPEDLRVGDVIEIDGDYGIVERVDDDSFRFYAVNRDGAVYRSTCDFDEEYLDDMFTRYPDSSSSQADDELANGDPAKESNVKKVMSSLENSNKYGNNEEWTSASYTSDVLGKGRGAEGFAFSLSDQIFGELEERYRSNTNNLMVGDIVYDEDEDVLGVVAEIDEDEEEARCVGLDSDDVIDWDIWVDFRDIDTILTRYP